MRRKIVRIDEEKCDGCGLCTTACVENAIGIINGKAHLISEIYCDGLGACLGFCPRGAITIEEREAENFDEEKTVERMEKLKSHHEKAHESPSHTFACPGSVARTLSREPRHAALNAENTIPSMLSNWPVKLKLVSPSAPFLKNANLLIVADCVPFALSSIHTQFMEDRIVLAGCPKFDDADSYVEKLTIIFRDAVPKSVAVLRMEVPCCGGLVRIIEKALKDSQKNIPLESIVIGIKGDTVSQEVLQTV